MSAVTTVTTTHVTSTHMSTTAMSDCDEKWAQKMSIQTTKEKKKKKKKETTFDCNSRKNLVSCQSSTKSNLQSFDNIQ
jgi:hypothetical protein